MSLADLLYTLRHLSPFFIIIMASLPVITVCGGYILKRFASFKACSFFLSFCVHLAVIPGICTVIIIGYLFFFTGTNLFTQVDFFVSLTPIVSMILTLVIIRRFMPFSEIPGFDRLSGLMIICGACFVILLFLYRVRFFIGFFAPLEVLVFLFIVLFVLIKVGIRLISGKKNKLPDR